MYWEELTQSNFKDAIKKTGGVCVIPMGCLEKHGQHMPVGTDQFIAEDVIDAACKLEEVMIFRIGGWFGDVTPYHAQSDSEEIMGAIALSTDFLVRILEEVCDEIARNGFDKIIICSSHGGNVPFLHHFLRCQAYSDKPYSTMWAWAVRDELTEPDKLVKLFEEKPEEFKMITDKDIKALENFIPRGFGGGHADFREVALVMAHHPELIDDTQYEDPFCLVPAPFETSSTNPNTGKQEISLANGAFAGNWSCYYGYPPHGASQNIGLAMEKIQSERLARIFKRAKESNDIYNVVTMDRK